MGFVHCVAQETSSGIVASGGGDGRIIFWDRSKASTLEVCPCQHDICKCFVQAICCFNHGGPVLALAACATSKASSCDGVLIVIV